MARAFVSNVSGTRRVPMVNPSSARVSRPRRGSTEGLRGRGDLRSAVWLGRRPATTRVPISSQARSVPDTIPAAYTLLEVVLALALTTVILGLIGVAVNIHLRVADVSRAEVEEAQLARTLLQRIADNLRNATPYVPSSADSGSTLGSGELGGLGRLDRGRRERLVFHGQHLRRLGLERHFGCRRRLLLGRNLRQRSGNPGRNHPPAEDQSPGPAHRRSHATRPVERHPHGNL